MSPARPRRCSLALMLLVGALHQAAPAHATYYGRHEAHGAIEATYLRYGGPQGPLGTPVTNELTTPDGRGRYNHFSRGASIYWTAATGAREVHGAIRERWAAVGWERSALGYPVSDELTTPDGVGRFSAFVGGAVYWTPGTGAHEVYGEIHRTWAELGWETGNLGYPVSGEYAVHGGRRTDFQNGSISWTPAQGAAVSLVLKGVGSRTVPLRLGPGALVGHIRTTGPNPAGLSAAASLDGGAYQELIAWAYGDVDAVLPVNFAGGRVRVHAAQTLSIGTDASWEVVLVTLPGVRQVGLYRTLDDVVRGRNTVFRYSGHRVGQLVFSPIETGHDDITLTMYGPTTHARQVHVQHPGNYDGPIYLNPGEYVHVRSADPWEFTLR